MKRKRTYQAERVEQIDIEVLFPLVAAGCIVALDVAKQKFVVALATFAGEVIKLFRFNHPTETRRFMSVVEALRSRVEPGKLKAAMEPTGTYGDAVRHQLVRAGVPVVMVSPKRTHDSQELFDNVRSLHDPKSAVLIAKLCAMGLSTEWKPPPTTRVRLRALVDLRRHEYGREEACFGRLEAVLARHWPEYGQWMDVRKQKTALLLLAQTPSAAGVAAAPDETKAFVRRTSRGRLGPALVEGLIADSTGTMGVDMVPEEEQLVRTLAVEALAARQRGEELEDEMRKLTTDDDVFERLSRWMGVHTAAVIITSCDPRQYANARQLEKACGLNLREKSSGEHRGRLSITKRGPGAARQMLYMFALRMIESSSVVRAWYMRRRGYTEESKQRAVVAVMRKLVRALFHVAKGAEFDPCKLFDVRRLDIDVATIKDKGGREQRLTPRTTKRAAVRTRRAKAASTHAST